MLTDARELEPVTADENPHVLSSWIGPLPASVTILASCCGRAVLYAHAVDDNRTRMIPWPRCSRCGGRPIVARRGIRIYVPSSPESGTP